MFLLWWVERVGGVEKGFARVWWYGGLVEVIGVVDVNVMCCCDFQLKGYLFFILRVQCSCIEVVLR